MRPLTRLLAALTAAVLLAFSARRLALLVAALTRRGPRRALVAHTPRVLILAPCRDEAASLPGLCAALDALDYPRERLRVVIVDDGSTDATARVAFDWTSQRPGTQTLALPGNRGKAAALNEALRLAGEAEVVVVYDADHRPEPGALRALVAPFADPRVAGVSGQMRVANGEASPAAFYAMLESEVHQLVTMRGKDRLGLAPALLGANCAYRLSALRAAGGFHPGALLEDNDLTLALAAAGWHTRFAPHSISTHAAPVTVAGYARQHLRWNRGFHQSAGARLGALWANPRLSALLKLELTFFALGYADRLALAAGALLALNARQRRSAAVPAWVWAVYFGAPAAEMLAALRLAGEPPRMYARLVYVPFFFALDVAIAAWGALQSLGRRPARWAPTERPPLPAPARHSD